MARQKVQTLENILLELNLISGAQLELLKIESGKSGRPLEEIISNLKIISDENLVKAKAVALDVDYVDLSGRKINAALLRSVPYSLAKNYQAVPFDVVEGELNTAMLDPTNVQVIDYLEKRIGKRIKPFMASPSSIQQALSQYQGTTAADVKEALKTVEITAEAGSASLTKIREMMEDAPVTRAVNTILESAINSRASDIHIEPKDKDLRIRYRIDGVLHEVMSLDKSIHPAIVSRIKILSNLKIDEHRLPQDGQFEVRTGGSEVDVRVAVSPLVAGEKVVLRLLNKTATPVTLDELGLVGRAYRIVNQGTKQPHGMILTTGPTGSGKTTTLFAILRELNTQGTNIVTIEDPVEYHVDGVNQIQVNTQIGLTFASALRSILRQDPNVVMVGEIRDAETADLAVQASLTGHVVLTTLHTNSSSGILPRLLDLGIEPYLIASTLTTGMAQRLVRQICPHCKEKFAPTTAQRAIIKKTVAGVLPEKNNPRAKEIFQGLGYPALPYLDDATYTLYKGKGCDECAGTGYLGRIAIFEVFAMSGGLEEILLAHPTTAQVQAQAVKEGMLTLRQDGVLKALSGITTIDEVFRVAADY